MTDSTPARSEPLNILVFGAADILMRPILKQVENQLPRIIEAIGSRQQT